MAIVDDARRCCPLAPFAGDNDDRAAEASTTTTTTCIEDLPADVLALVLRRLDGASLAALACASAAFRDLAADPVPWRALCLALWPSLLHTDSDSHSTAAKPHSHNYYQRLFADAFPFPTITVPQPRTTTLPTRLVSFVDLRQGDTCIIMSRVVETDTTSEWFLDAPFRIDALAQEAFTAPTASPIVPGDLELSWVLMDPSSGRAVNASSRRAVAVDRRWLTGETVVRFALVLAGGGGGTTGASAVVLDAAVTCDERRGHVREVSLGVCVEEEDAGAEGGGGVSGREGLAVVAAAMAGARRGGRAAGAGGEEEAARVRYEEFVKGRAERKERMARREGIIDLCCSGVGAVAILVFMVMLTLR